MDVELTEGEIEETFNGVFDKETSNTHEEQNLRFATASEAEMPVEHHLRDRVASKPKSKER